jgi:hypothetical protein
VLKFVSRHPGCTNADIEAYVREMSPSTAEQAGGYLKILIDRYRMLERRLPVFAKPQARRGRYYLRDNFLRSWLAALHSPVSAINFQPESALVEQADNRLADVEGHGLERLAAQLYEERSRRGIGDFPLTRRIEGYWDRKDTEIDLVALSEEERVIRFGTVKRNAQRLLKGVATLGSHIDRFLEVHRQFDDWTIERVAIAPTIDATLRRALEQKHVLTEDLEDLVRDL